MTCAGRYKDRDDPSAPWQPCRVLDLSLGGAGLELLGTVTVSVGDGLVVDLAQSDGEDVEIVFTGEVRHVRASKDGTIVGVEFVGVTPTTVSLLMFLLERSDEPGPTQYGS